MPFSAGEVYAVLGARVDPSGFRAYDAALARTTGAASKAEAATAASAAAMTKAGNASSGAAAAMSKFGTAAKTAGIAGAAALATGLVASIKAASSFQQQMSELQAVTGASSRDMRRFADAAKAMGAKTGVGATEASKALIELAKGGMTAKNILGGGFAGAVALAQAGTMGLDDAANAVVKTLAQFKLQGRDATHVADALASAANATSMDVSDFTQALAQGGAAASSAGLSFDDTINVLAAMADKFQSGSDMGTSLKTTLTQLASPTKRAQEELKKLGIEAFDANGKIKPAPKLVDELAKAFHGLTSKQKLQAASMIAGTDGMRALIALSDSAGKNIIKAGSAQEVASKKTDNLAGAWNRFKASLQNAAITVGTPLLKPLADGLDWVTRQFTKLTDGSSKVSRVLGDLGSLFGDLVDVIGTIGGVLGDLKFDQVFTGLFDVLRGVVGTIKSILHGDLKGILSGLGTVLLGSLKAITAPIRGIGQQLYGPFKWAVDKILGLLTTLMGGVSSTFSALGKIPGPVGAPFRAAAHGIDDARDAIDGLRESIRGTPKNALSPLAAALQKLRGTKLEPKVLHILTRGDMDARSKIRALRALGIPAKTAKLLVEDSQAKRGVKEVREAVGQLRGRTIIINAVTNGLISGVQAALDWLSRLRSKTVTVNVHTTNTGSSPRGRATGRAAGAGRELALVGEGRDPRETVFDPATGQGFITAGPTLAVLSDSAYVIPHDPSMRARSGSLLEQLARDLGVPGFKKGKPAKKTASKPKAAIPTNIGRPGGPLGFPDPAAFTPTRLPLESLERRVSDAETTDSKRQSRLRELSRSKKPADKAKVPGARRAADQSHAALVRARRLARQARNYQAQIDRAQTLVGTYETRMRTANLAGDRKGWTAASDARRRGLAALRALLVKAYGALGLKNTQAGADLDAAIASTDLAIAEAGTAMFEEQAQDDSTFTPEQARRLAELDRDIAVAALSEGIGDDISAAVAKRDYLEALFAGSAGRSPEAVKDLADQLRTARDNVTSLTSPAGTVANDNQDLQAQIDQANARAQLAEQNAALNARLWGVWNGPGDLGTSVVVNMNMLTGADPRVARSAADAVVGGLGYQRGQPSPRVGVG